MSILIDRLVQQNQARTQSCLDDKWYIAKPLCYFRWKRFQDAWRIIIGKSRAYHFKADEKVKEK
jgi:hypothetical protein